MDQQAIWLDRQHVAVPKWVGGGVHMLISGPEWAHPGDAYTQRVVLENAGGRAPTDGFARQAGGSHGETRGWRGLVKSDDYRVMHLPTSVTDEVLRQWLTCQLLVEGERGETGIQLAGVLDDVYAPARHARLGAYVAGMGWRFALWAPTARNVSLKIWHGGKPQTIPARRDDLTGVWDAYLNAEEDDEYLWIVDVYSPAVGRWVVNEVTDPYAVGLTVDSRRCVLVDMENPALFPKHWPTPKPIHNPCERVIYELHVRDFSAADTSVPLADRGTYRAFTHPDSDGMKHLAKLREAGVNTIHLLPIFDFATVPENPDQQHNPVIERARGAALEPQEEIGRVRKKDAYNWGYDPLHYLAPEGSYATQGHQRGGARVLQCRQMIAALNAAGFDVVVDQVFNHTYAAGQDPHSILDRIVPGYYHRLCARGDAYTTTCCPNVATEHMMAEKLMVEAVAFWIRNYRVGGLRFDLMGFHSRQNMEKVVAQLPASAYVYGEGWDFGEVQDNAVFYQAKQGQLDGTGIGCFNDRVRDALRGGSPVDASMRSRQGFASGLLSAPNGVSTLGWDEQHEALARATDRVKLALVGNLLDYPLAPTAESAPDPSTPPGVSAKGPSTPNDVSAAVAAGAFATQPAESVNYVEAHDDETLYDVMAYKLPTHTSTRERARACMLALAVVTWGQSPVFWAAGTEILRSKSMDRDSFDSGDYFNAIDWTLHTHNFGIGLPPRWSNAQNWGVMAPLLEDARLRPTTADMRWSFAVAREFLRVRTRYRALTLGDAQQIIRRVSFVPAPAGVVVMHINNEGGPGREHHLLVCINGWAQQQTVAYPQLAGTRLRVNPVQRDGADHAIMATVQWDQAAGKLTLPARTAVVLTD
ncbi:DUF3372 domain-containing protein [Gleimia hominis]|uniref:DUF3372 domain-containing protein n=1 Tax=Gleimia hominis TaxID=595468 RepID=A0ABU3I8Q9_9ACTO|nr:alpha-1,6-glucosidase domain-containing protein [Gleimia hominis]MDT3766756.1 DUF3372 domain-containing protein [Gleimia hominis]